MSVDFEKITALQGQVIDLVPPEERDRFKYWRGAHIGRMALNFSTGSRSLEPGSLGVMHFADSYWYARNVANDLLTPQGTRRLQFTDKDAAQLEKISGVTEIGLAGPSIVFALDERFNHGIGLSPSSYGAGHGYTIPGRLTLESLDPYSRQALTSILEA